jgi:hypothetical protein
MPWVLRNGKYVRVHLNIDPCWNSLDIASYCNLYAKFVCNDYDEIEARSLATAEIWKRKWVGTVYDKKTESILGRELNT